MYGATVRFMKIYILILMKIFRDESVNKYFEFTVTKNETETYFKVMR